MHEQLHSDERISVFLTVEDDDLLRLEVVAASGDVDLSVADEVVVAMDGEAVEVEVEDPAHAVAVLGAADELDGKSFTVMLRVYEFFEGWDFGPDAE
jgi:hypothetical protein